MMSAHVGDIGVEITFDVGEDISTATVHKLVYQKPTGTVGEFLATIAGTALKYTTTALADLDVMGTWNMQAYIEMPGWTGYSDLAQFQVIGNLR